MRIQFILGKPGTGKTTFCHREIVDCQAEQSTENLILIVPEQFSFQSEKALLAASESGALSRARVLSFNRLCYFVLSITGGMGKVILENCGKNMVLRKIISRLDKELKYFRTAKETRGFLDSLATAITEFYQYGIAPEDLAAQADSAKNSSLGLKLHDLQLIYAAYREFLEESFISNDEVLDILAEKIEQADFLQDAKIWIDGFKSFTPQEKKVLAALVSVANQVKIALPAPRAAADFGAMSKFDIYSEVVQTMQVLAQIGAELGAKMEEALILKDSYRHDEAADLAFLCENYLGFDIGNIYHERPENIQIFSTSSIFNEIDTAARIVTMLTRERGYKYSEIGLIAADLARYEKFVPAIFSRDGIPVFVDMRRSILGHPIAEMILSACQIISTNWSYEAVFRMLKLPVFNFRDEIDLLENYALAYNIRGKDWQEDFHLGDESELESLNLCRQKVLAIMAALSDNCTPRRKYPLRDFAHWVYNFLAMNSVNDILEDWANDAQRRGDNETQREHEQIWDAIMHTLGKMVEILPEQNENISGFAKIFEAGLGDLGLAPPALDQLVLGDLRRSRFGELKAMIILGAKDGALPARPDGDGLLSDDDRLALAGAGLALAKDSAAKIYEEEFLIYENISKPREFLAITYPAGDLEGRGANPSRLIQRIRALFPRIGEGAHGFLSLIAGRQRMFGDLSLALGRHAAYETPISPEFAAVYDYFEQDEIFAQKLADMDAGVKFTQETTKSGLSKNSVSMLYRPNIRSSVSRLQRYISCPFAYFAQYNLAAKKRKIYDVAAVDMGNIYHDILSKFGEVLKVLGPEGAADTERVATLINGAVDEVFGAPGNYQLHSSGRYTHFAHKMRAISQASAAALANHLSGGDFALAYNEIAFGGADSGADTVLPPIEIELSADAKMLLEGRIDRVDIGRLEGADYVKIIDYKSGRKQFSLEEVYYGLDMQLLIYLGAFIQKLAQARGEGDALKILPAAAFYFNLLNPLLDFDYKLNEPEVYKKKLLDAFKMSGLVLDDESVIMAMQHDADSFKKSGAIISAEAFAALMDHVKNLAKEAGRAMLAGEIPISPYKHKNQTPCGFCDFHSICKFDAQDQGAYRNLRAIGREGVMEKIFM
ncbi:MAG: exodeoxyribonuclease V subunit gamma [Clostridiales bacterium]|jgi:ATP-dependent helicase/nuclease subunit B|nr:exodeoxyribonuclease V subunit gamma [Clostridiales bacterium]